MQQPFALGNMAHQFMSFNDLFLSSNNIQLFAEIKKNFLSLAVLFGNLKKTILINQKQTPFLIKLFRYLQ